MSTHRRPPFPKRALFDAALPLAAALTLLLPLASWAQPLPPGTYPSANEAQVIDPPSEVARLNLTEGTVSFSSAQANAQADASAAAWHPATLNRPLTTGDRLWSGPGARSELHMGSTAVRLSEQTSLDFVALTDSLAQLYIGQGSVQLRVRTLYEGQRLEVDTPNLAFVISAPGDYRVDVDPALNTTRVVAQAGQGVLYGDNGAVLNLSPRQQGTFSGTQLTPAAAGAVYQDNFDTWTAERDRQEDASVSARYVPRDTLGYQQLDTYGDWQQDPQYGAVWLPRSVPANWAPYRAGHWSWINPWGWTWIDDQPWGFAPFHYGRWAEIGPRWAWVPGSLPRRPVYAPALVGFIGGSSGGLDWRISGSSGGAMQPGVGWFPLAPGEAYRPVYRTSPRYLQQINQNIVIQHSANTAPRYRYQLQPAAVTAARREDFMGNQTRRPTLRSLSAQELAGAQVLQGAQALPLRPFRPVQSIRAAEPLRALQPVPPVQPVQPVFRRAESSVAVPPARLPPQFQGRELTAPRGAPPAAEERQNTLRDLSRQQPRPILQAPVAVQPPPERQLLPRQAPIRVAPAPQESRNDAERDQSLRQLDEARKQHEAVNRANRPAPQARRFPEAQAQPQPQRESQPQQQMQPELRRRPAPQPEFRRDTER